MAECESSDKSYRFLPIILFLAALCLRLPFTSKYLYHHDSVNFALALDQFDLRLHQPHPPGYLLYVLSGRLLNLFIPDGNLALIVISIVFTSLTVVFIYLLGKEMYDLRTGIIASVMAMGSPNLWFHGEVALTYGVEAFFSVAVAYLSWQLLKGRGDLVWLAAVLIGVAGGFRQNTCLFLLPLWFVSVRKLNLGKVLAGLALVAALCGTWLAITVGMTGGLEAYGAAFRSLWSSNTGHNSVFEAGWRNGWLFAKTLATFTLLSLGAGTGGLAVGLYRMVRARDWKSVDPEQAWFFAAWIAPAYLFYQLIFIHPANPGYFLILLPPLVLLSARGLIRAADALDAGWGSSWTALATVAVVVANSAMFLGTQLPVSAQIIAKHDRDLGAMLRELRTLDPATTAIVLRPSIFYGFRMVMYYLPQYHVYNSDNSGEIFAGFQGDTVLSNRLELPGKLTTTATVEFKAGDGNRHRIPGLKDAWLVLGAAEANSAGLSGVAGRSEPGARVSGP